MSEVNGTVMHKEDRGDGEGPSVDNEAQWPSGRLKIRISGTNKRSIEIIKWIIPHVGRFNPEYKDCFANINEKSIEVHTMGVDDYGEPWTEVHFELAAREWARTLLKVMSSCQSLFVHYTQNPDRCDLRLEGVPVVVASERVFFAEICWSSHMEVPITNVYFGNLLYPGHFLFHYQRTASNDLNDEAERRKILQKMRCRNLSHTMFVDFEHDRDCLVVRFALMDGGNKQTNANIRLKGSAASMKVKYSSIRRILVDTVAMRGPNYITRLFLHLNYPPELRKQMQKRENNQTDGQLLFDGDRYRYLEESDMVKPTNRFSKISDSPMMCLEFTDKVTEGLLYELLSRLFTRCHLPIEFGCVDLEPFNNSKYLYMPVRIIGPDYRKQAGEDDPQYEIPEPNVNKDWERQLRECGNFELEYLIAALLSRGAVVKDQILRSRDQLDTFLTVVIDRYRKERIFAREALERLLNMIDEMKQVPSIIDAFQKIYDGVSNDPKGLLEQLELESKKEGYIKVRKVVITPTRTLLVVPEMLMGNRVVRKYDLDRCSTLRIQFRDEDNTHLRKNMCGPTIIKSTVENTLRRGIHIGDRHFVYLASSNSQMRDNGCYFFYNGDGNAADQVRKDLGTFDRTNIPKLMARMGQCFTQAQECEEVELRDRRWIMTHDFIGGDDRKGEPYIFSDGVGTISVAFAKRIAQDLDLGSCVPSCFQIRFRGVKGVLSVDPTLDEFSSWVKENKVESTNLKHGVQKLNVCFRPSQVKFEAPMSKTIEIVKFSSPTGVCLNRPFISILDQVSAMQGFHVHMHLTERINALLDRQLMQLAEMLMSEDRCRERLGELPRRINVERLSLSRGFALTQEPFFRSLLRASVSYTLKKQLAKEQIQIPFNLGRSMFGVVDETGILQYGQVFVQYTVNINLKTPGPHAEKRVLVGRVLMTKNPSVVAGDARMFNAIDIPELRHLVDVVVFPQSGPRPHPDEMAGSDLDGDEYSVIWDPDLFLERSEDPMDFPKSTREPDDVPEDQVVEKMRQFFVDYISQDSIGSIANAFLVNSDLYGISSEVCMNIAQKHSQSVDFPKTGMPPPPLERRWTERDGVPLPPERAERWPDFMSKTFESSYVSPRITGELFRRIRLVDDVLRLVTAVEDEAPVEVDPMMEYPGWEAYKSHALFDFNAYSAHFRSLLENYGIADEGQLFSGCISQVRNRISDKDSDDMSLFNTAYVIEKKVSKIFMKFRCEFFEQFGGFMENTEPDGHRYNNARDEDDRRVCVSPSEEMKKKASAYYMVCYGSLMQKESGRRILSFPWAVWDVLAQVKQDMRSRLKADDPKSGGHSLDPLSEQLSQFIKAYCEENEEELLVKLRPLKRAAPAIRRYCRKYKGLDDLMYVLIKWGEAHEIFEEQLQREHLCLLLIQFGTGHLFAESMKRASNFLEKTDELLEKNSDKAVDMKLMLGGVGRCFVRFLQFLSSRSFETSSYLSFVQPNLNYRSVMLRGQWLTLHREAVKSFYRIMLISRFDELPLTKTETSGHNSRFYEESLRVTEMEPFMIEVPDDLEQHDEKLRRKMQKYSRVKHLMLRRVNDRKDKVIVSAVGSLESQQRLRDLVAVRPILNTQADSKTRSEMMVRLVYERLQSLD